MIWAVFAVAGVLMVYGIVTLIQYHLDGIRLKKLIERRLQRDKDKQQAKGM